MSEKLNYVYSKSEEKFNVLTHGFGLLASCIAFPFLVYKSFSFTGFWKPVSLIIFGLSLLILYAASTFYHAEKDPKRRRKLNIFDHAAIYVLIAGTYTPFMLISLEGKTGTMVCLFTWIFALIGIVLKFFFTGKYDILSTILYVLMGWQALFVFNPLKENLSQQGVEFLFVGGVFYTIGAVLYAIKKIPYNHAIFHFFVLLGSFSHFIAVYYYIK